VVRRCAAILFCLLCLSAAAVAQNALPVLPTGDAAVAGFSGTVIVGSPPEARRLDKTIINLDGPALRVIGLDRLRVIDASVMPVIISGNTNAPTMMIAEKGAALMLNEAGNGHG